MFSHSSHTVFSFFRRRLGGSAAGRALVVLAVLIVFFSVSQLAGQAVSLPPASIPTPTSTPPNPGQAEIVMVPGTIIVEEQVTDAIRDALVQAGDVVSSADYYAISALQDEGNWLFVSVVGLMNLDTDLNWNLQDNASWYGLVLLRQDENGLWTGAVEGTTEFSLLLADVPETILTAQAKQDLNPRQFSTAASSSSYAFPWQAGTSMQYGSLGVHDNGFISGWKAVDFISDGNTSQGHAPNRLLAAASGTISYVCNDGTSVAIRIGDLMYTHLLYNGNLHTGHYFNQCDELGQLKPGSFSDTCGYADQGPGWFHVHWGFPNAGSFQAEGWTLSFSDQKWRKGGEAREIYDWFQAETCGCSDVAAVGENSSRQQQFVDAFNRNGGKANLGCTENGAHWWGPAVAQDFTGVPGICNDAVIIQDEPNDSPLGTIPAYVVRGEIWRIYRDIGGPETYLGPPTSDEFTNAGGAPQSNFGGGYITFDNGSMSWRDFHWPTSFSQWKAEYYNNKSLVGYPTMVRNESSPNHDWQGSAPDDGKIGVFADGFSVRWTRTLNFAEGYYRFSTFSDDGVRVWVDSTQVINSFVSGGSQSHTGDIQLSSGNHTVKIEYFDDWGPAYFDISWEQTDSPSQVAMAIDSPKEGADVEGTINVGGWAIDRASSSGTGVSQVHVYRDGTAGGGGVGLGVASYGGDRPDVAAVYGSQFRYSGYNFSWNSNTASLGDHTLYVYVYSTISSSWSHYQRHVHIVDTTPPSQASNLRPNGWTGPYTTDSMPAFTWDSASDARGVAGYYIALNDWTPDGGFGNDWAIDNVTSWTVPDSAALADGSHFVAVTSRDNTGLVNPTNTNQQGDAPYYEFIVDTTSPSGATSLTVNGLSAHGDSNGDSVADGNYINDSTPVFHWTPGQDATSGIAEQWGSFSDWAPEYNDTLLGGGSVGSYVVPDSQPLSDGPHFFAISTEDKAGNRDVPNASSHAGAGHHIHFYVDTVAPTSAVAVLPAKTTDPTFTVTWSGSDGASGVISYDVQVRDGVGGTWQDWLVGTTEMASVFSGQVNHIYYFRSRARDQAGNVEDWPGGDGDTYTHIEEDHRIYLPAVFR